MNILISTDTSCLINNELLTNYDISIFPLNVIIDNKEYLDGVTIKQDFLLSEMRANKNIKTSTPPLGTVIEYFEKLFEKGYDKIIHFTISSKLSSMFNLFSSVSANYFDNKIIVLDTLSVSSTMLSNVLLAYEEAKKGTNIDEIIEKIKNRISDTYLFIIPENLTALKNGGRISPAIAAIGNTIGLKPIIILKDGELVKGSMAMNVKKAYKDKLDSLIEKYPISNYDYTLIEFGADDNTLNKIKLLLNEKLGESNYISGLLPINVCAHCGPGTIGLVISKKINEKSLLDF